MNIVSFIAEHWITLSISLAVAILFVRKQWLYYSNNAQKLGDLRKFFLADRTEYSTFQKDEVTLIQTVKDEENAALNNLIKEINLYIEKSIGTADFNIIQNKTERCIGSMYEHATGELSFPTYFGLMGTFTGTFIGLVGFLASGSDLSDENKVTNLIIGVLVSMVTSLFGLYLTTKSNHDAAHTKKQIDEEKNEFLDFIQLELIPKLQTTITTLQQTMEGFVPKFDVVINNFEKTFTGVIGRFKETFDQCTDNFGTEFRQNSSLISKTVSTLNESIGKITDNVENQRKLLEELRSEKMFDTLQQFVDSAQVFQASTNLISEYNTMLDNMMMVSQHVIEKQNEYAESLQIPSELVKKLTALLDRISTFEDSINALGENISQAEMLGNQELALIKRHLESFEEKKQLADRFLDRNNEELEGVFKLQIKTVKSLFDDYRQQLDEEREALSTMVREMLLIINKKKTDLLNHLENAFDVTKVHAMFSHLQTLPEIASKLDKVEMKLTEPDQLKKHVQTLEDNAIQLKETIKDCTAEQIRAFTVEGERLSNNVANIDSQQRENNKKELYQTKQSLIDRIDSLQIDVNDKIESIHSDLNVKSVQISKQIETATSEIESNAGRISEENMHLSRDLSKKLSSNVAEGITIISDKMIRQSESTEQLVRTASEQALDALEGLAKEEQLSTLIESLYNNGRSIQDILDVLKQQKQTDING
jgi:hypothetical protein